MSGLSLLLNDDVPTLPNAVTLQTSPPPFLYSNNGSNQMILSSPISSNWGPSPLSTNHTANIDHTFTPSQVELTQWQGTKRPYPEFSADESGPAAKRGSTATARGARLALERKLDNAHTTDLLSYEKVIVHDSVNPHLSLAMMFGYSKALQNASDISRLVEESKEMKKCLSDLKELLQSQFEVKDSLKDAMTAYAKAAMGDPARTNFKDLATVVRDKVIADAKALNITAFITNPANRNKLLSASRKQSNTVKDGIQVLINNSITGRKPSSLESFIIDWQNKTTGTVPVSIGKNYQRKAALMRAWAMQCTGNKGAEKQESFWGGFEKMLKGLLEKFNGVGEEYAQYTDRLIDEDKARFGSSLTPAQDLTRSSELMVPNTVTLNAPPFLDRVREASTRGLEDLARGL